MPTLREEMERDTRRSIPFMAIRPSYDKGFDDGWCAALRNYGDYEIVEGELRIGCAGRIWTGLFNLPITVGERYIANTGQCIKILAPPRKPVAERNQQPSEREEEMEAGLHLIRYIVTTANLDGSALAAIDTIARRALEEKDE